MTKYTWEHIHLRSPDPGATAQWYEDKLGAEVIRTPQPDGSTRFDLDLTGQKIFIAKADPAATGPSPQTPYMGLEHIGLTVENIDAAVAELKGPMMMRAPCAPASAVLPVARAFATPVACDRIHARAAASLHSRASR